MIWVPATSRIKYQQNSNPQRTYKISQLCCILTRFTATSIFKACEFSSESVHLTLIKFGVMHQPTLKRKKARTLNYQEKNPVSKCYDKQLYMYNLPVRSAQSKTSISAHSSLTYNTSSILVTICSAHARSFSRVTRSLSLSASSLVSSLSAKVSPMLRFCLKGLGENLSQQRTKHVLLAVQTVLATSFQDRQNVMFP